MKDMYCDIYFCLVFYIPIKMRMLEWFSLLDLFSCFFIE